jgi:sulfatase modifying factor 1
MSRMIAASLAGLVTLVLTLPSVLGNPPPATGRCPEEMVPVIESARSFCIDRHEASLEELRDDGSVHPFPANRVVGKAKVRARSVAGVVPQGYISRAEAAEACARSSKRLCTASEWTRACKGTVPTRYPYGERRRAGACNDKGVEPLAKLASRDKISVGDASTWGIDRMNDPRLHTIAGGVARTGRFDRCTTEEGVHDMVGNVHEWTAEESGTMRGGFYLDTTSLGEGCDYDAGGHDANYHDYSTGFRCCVDPK